MIEKNNYPKASIRAQWCWAAIACFASTGFAQSNASGPTQVAPSFAIRGFELTGDIPLPTDETTRVLAPFISSQATIETLQQASAALEAAMNARGFMLHRVTLPPQEVGDKVTLSIVKFVIGKVVVEGAKHYSEGNIRASVPELKEGDAPSFQRLAVQTAIANENPTKRIQVGLRESEEPDRIDARVVVVDEQPLNFFLGLSNTGNEASGRDRLSLVAAHNNVMGLDHQASLAYTTSLERADNVKQLGLSHKVPLYALGGVLGVNYTNSNVLGQFGSFSSTGAGETYGVTYNHYLAPQGGLRKFFTFTLDDKTFNATKLSVGAGGPQYFPGGANPINRRSQPLGLGYAMRRDSDDTSWAASLNWVVNTTDAGSGSLASYKAEDPRVQTVAWKALRGDLSYTQAVSAGWLLAARAQFQYSSDALIAGEQYGIGGAGSVRGTSERPISGDSGASGSLEVMTPEWTSGLRGVVFLDAGVLTNNNTTGTSKLLNDGLTSAGLGLRYGAGHFGVTAEWARVLRGSSIPLAASPTGTPRDGDDKLHVNLTARF